MKIFLDDYRIPENKQYFIVTNYEACISLIKVLPRIDSISLDYDLGEIKTGFDVVYYMYLNQIYPNEINIHSTHSFGRQKMYSFIKANFPGGINVTMKKYDEI